MASGYRDFTVRPRDGGHLITALSQDEVPAESYVTKRDWRRELDEEIRREGFDFFREHKGAVQGLQALPQYQPNAPVSPLAITLIHLLRHPNGKTALIVGTATTLYRYYSMGNGPYYSTDPADYPGGQIPNYYATSGYPVGEIQAYFSDEPGWAVIGTGFAATAQRWESLNINGYAVFNNGVDLPITYRLDEAAVTPIYELREAGIASVGCIAEKNGALVCGDISEIIGTYLPTWMGGATPYGVLTDQTKLNRIQYRIINSVVNQPRRWAATVNGTVAANSPVVTMAYPVKGLLPGMSVLITGAGTNGANLTTVVVNVAGTSLIVADPVITGVTNALIQASDSLAAGVAFYDLQDDSSGIIRMLALKDILVVYKDTSIFFGTYVGRATGLFDFVIRVKGTSKSVFYRNTLIIVNDAFHVYGGRNAFYQFDLTNQTPLEINVAQMVANVFFDQAQLANQNSIFAADNAVTREAMFWFPSATEDKAICYDYRHLTCSTTSMEATAAATVKKPFGEILSNVVEENIFIMGVAAGYLTTYGKTDRRPTSSGVLTATQSGTTVTANGTVFTVEDIGRSIKFSNDRVTPILAWISGTQVTVGDSITMTALGFSVLSAIWHRLGNDYTSVLQGGLSPWGDHFNEKDLERYVLTYGSQSPNCPILFEILGTRNSAEGAAVLGSQVLTKTADMVAMFYRQNYFQDRLTISGRNNPARILARIFRLSGVRSQSFIRRAA